MENAAFKVMQMLAGKWVSSAVSAAATFGIADVLKDHPRTAEEIAVQAGMKLDGVRRLMRVLLSLGLFELDAEGRYWTNELAKYLEADAQPSLLAMAKLMAAREEMQAWVEFPSSLRTGQSGFHQAHGMEKFPYLAGHEAYGELFNAAMTSFSSAQIDAILERYSFEEFTSVIDVGGGHGHLLADILGKHSKLLGCLFERSQVLEPAKNYLRQAEVLDRCALVEGDFFDQLPVGHDVYLFKHVIHDWDDNHATEILRNCRAVMKRNACVLVIEMILEDGPDALMSQFLDLEMMVMTPGGRQRTILEYAELFGQSGFQLTRVIQTSAAVSIIEGRPA